MVDDSLFDDPDLRHGPDPAERRAVRRQVLGGILRLIRGRNAWSVNDAASAASIAPMTWRRLEDGLDVRKRTLTALDSLLGQPFGTVRRALDDDLVMVSLTGLAEVDTAAARTMTRPFDELAVNRDREEDNRRTRRLALGGALQLVRASNGWTVLDAAHHAKLAPMTVRRIEDGLPVRDRSYAALDGLLGLVPGTVKRALADDRVMTGLIKTATGQDVTVVGGLAPFADQTRTNSPRQQRESSRWPAVGPETSRALAMAASHVPTEQPTVLEMVNRVLERLAREQTQTPAIRELVRAAAAAVPDLIARQLDECEREMDPNPAEQETAGREPAASGAA